MRKPTIAQSTLFRCGRQLLAFPRVHIAAVLSEWTLSLPLPRQPHHCLGAAIHEGQQILVFDLGAHLGLRSPRESAALTGVCLVVVRTADPGLAQFSTVGASHVGWVVDELLGESDLPLVPVYRTDALPALETAASAARTCDGKPVLVLEPAALLTVRARHEIRLALDVLASHEL